MTATTASSNKIPGPLWLLSTFVASAAVMAVELLLTRLFSAVLWYHFVFAALSMTIFGLALGGWLMHRWAAARSHGALWLIAGGGGVVLMMTAISALPLAGFWPLYLLFSLPPFIFIGAFQSLAFMSYDQPGKLYFADLLGAALAAGGTILALRNVPLPVLAAFIAGVLVILGTALGFSQKTAGRVRLLVYGGGTLAFLTVALAAGLWSPRPGSRGAATKPLYDALANRGGRVVWSRWNEMSRVDVVDLGEPEVKYIYMDGGAVSQMFRFDGDLGKVSDLKGDNGYFPLSEGRRAKVAVIGAGGGKDVLVALLAGAKQITAIEINPGVVEAMRSFREFNGALYERPDVRLVVGDGRHFLEQSQERFDVVYLPLVMTQAADGIGLGLVENYAFTKEAFKLYLDRLSPGGRLVLKLHDMLDLNKALFTALQVLGKDSSEAEVMKNIYILNSRGHSGVMYPVLVVQKTPLSASASRFLLQQAQRSGFMPLYFPYGYERNLAALTSGRLTTGQLIRTAGPNLQPASDDRPFFYNYNRGLPGVLRALLFLVALGALLLTLQGVKRAPQRGTRDAHLGLWYFAGLGAAFMAIEVTFIQKSTLLLPMPTVTSAIVIGALLLGGAIGSLLSTRASLASCAKRLPAYLALAGVTATAYLAAFGSVARVIHGSQSGSVPILLGLFFLPLGLVMGLPFPSGLRLLKAASPDKIAAAWAVNGAFSVLGSVLAVTLATTVGYTMAVMSGVLIYAVLAMAVHASEQVKGIIKAAQHSLTKERRLADGSQA
ncbi:MAG: hypothetical protein ACM3ZC_16725 [Bacteroidota bacterium]